MFDYNIIKKIKTRPKVSIIITVYNGEKYLRECLESIKGQTLSEIEIICVDDGSTDNSYNILKEYKKNDSRFKVIKKEHSNAGDSRNFGLKNANGKYLLFLDCDDYFSKDLCNDTYNKAKLFDADIVFFEYETLMDDGNKKELKKIPLDSNILCNCTFGAEQLQDRLFQITAPCAWTKLFNRKFVIKNGLKFQSLGNTNDLFFTKTAITQAKRMVGLKKVLVTYRTNLKNSTQGKKDKSPLDFYDAYKQIRSFLIEKGIYENLKESFICDVISCAVWNYNTVKLEKSKEAIKEIFNKEGIKLFEIDKLFEKNNEIDEVYKKFKELFIEE
ncbi:MAG: glycosyltransferase family 2 protein [Clostridia bacterium]|nr:glycosyltransferase family 2 protein [Clostridia bacterium]